MQYTSQKESLVIIVSCANNCYTICNIYSSDISYFLHLLYSLSRSQWFSPIVHNPSKWRRKKKKRRKRINWTISWNDSEPPGCSLHFPAINKIHPSPSLILFISFNKLPPIQSSAELFLLPPSFPLSLSLALSLPVHSSSVRPRRRFFQRRRESRLKESTDGKLARGNRFPSSEQLGGRGSLLLSGWFDRPTPNGNLFYSSWVSNFSPHHATPTRDYSSLRRVSWMIIGDTRRRAIAGWINWSSDKYLKWNNTGRGISSTPLPELGKFAWWLIKERRRARGGAHDYSHMVMFEYCRVDGSSRTCTETRVRASGLWFMRANRARGRMNLQGRLRVIGHGDDFSDICKIHATSEQLKIIKSERKFFAREINNARNV